MRVKPHYSILDVITFTILSIWLAICMFIFGVIVGSAAAEKKTTEKYGLTGVVVNLSRGTDTVTIMDCNGNYWQFKGVEDYEIDDIVSCVVDTKGTDLIKDDEIIAARYGGCIWSWFE